MKGDVLVISGLSGAGKSTLAEGLREILEKRGRRVKLLDGDTLRTFFDGAFGHSSEDRLMVSKILAHAAYLLSEQGVDVLLATMFSQAGARGFLSRHVDYWEVYLDADLGHLMNDDLKGIYSESSNGNSPQIVGLDLDFHAPESPDLIIETHKEPPENSLARIIEFLRGHGAFGFDKD